MEFDASMIRSGQPRGQARRDPSFRPWLTTWQHIQLNTQPAVIYTVLMLTHFAVDCASTNAVTTPRGFADAGTMKA